MCDEDCAPRRDSSLLPNQERLAGFVSVPGCSADALLPVGMLLSLSHNRRPLQTIPRRADPYAAAPRLPDDEVLDLPRLMGTDHPIELEVGPGRGGFILERLQNDPAVVIVGLEIRRKWATIVDKKIDGLGYSSRGRVFAEDAKPALARFAPRTVCRIYVHFPDPWWKKRHHKRLVVSPDFASLAAAALVPGGELFVQTDVPDRADAYERVLSEHSAFEAWPSGARVEDPQFGARSPRERRAIADGLPIVRLRFRRRASGE